MSAQTLERSTAITAPQVGGIGRQGQVPSSTPILETISVSKKFKDVAAVNNLSLKVNHGEVLGFLGPNGAGKSTTVGMILGLIQPSSGTVKINGEELASHSAIVSENIGAIIENPAFYPYMSGRDNLKAHALAVGNIPDSRIDELLKIVNLHERQQHKYKTYSLGMKQRLGIASTLISNPALVILDEPTNGLDPAGQREIREIIPRLAEEGHGVLLASHMLHEVEQVSDRVVIVRRGTLITEGTVDDLLRRGGYIEVEVLPDELDRAMRAIRSVSAVEQVTADDGKLVVVAPQDAGRALNRAMVDAGIYAGAINPKRSTLEDIFLELTDEPSETSI